MMADLHVSAVVVDGPWRVSLRDEPPAYRIRAVAGGHTEPRAFAAGVEVAALPRARRGARGPGSASGAPRQALRGRVAVVAGATLILQTTADDADGIAQVVFSVGNTDIPGALAADGRTATAQWTVAGTAWQQITVRAADPEGAVGTASIRVRIKRK